MNVWQKLEKRLNEDYWPLVMGEIALLCDDGLVGLSWARKAEYEPKWLMGIISWFMYGECI